MKIIKECFRPFFENNIVLGPGESLVQDEWVVIKAINEAFVKDSSIEIYYEDNYRKSPGEWILVKPTSPIIGINHLHFETSDRVYYIGNVLAVR